MPASGSSGRPDGSRTGGMPGPVDALAWAATVASPLLRTRFTKRDSQPPALWRRPGPARPHHAGRSWHASTPPSPPRGVHDSPTKRSWMRSWAWLNRQPAFSFSDSSKVQCDTVHSTDSSITISSVVRSGASCSRSIVSPTRLYRVSINPTPLVVAPTRMSQLGTPPLKRQWMPMPRRLEGPHDGLEPDQSARPGAPDARAQARPRNSAAPLKNTRASTA